MATNIIPVILCGGSGTRLWPASRESYPKQFLNLMDDFSLLQNTVLRAMRLADVGADKVVTVTLDNMANEVVNQLSTVDFAATQHILREPSARNTAAAIAFAALYVSETFGDDALMWVLPADHHFSDERNLELALRHARRATRKDYLVTFGIEPHRAETGYGYIRLGDKFPWGAVHKADAFIEKPDITTAQAYVEAKNYLWNSGMFLFSTGVLLNEYATHADKTLKGVRKSLQVSGDPQRADAAVYGELSEQPFDKAIMERSGRVAVVPCNPGWSDIGSWESLWEIHQKDDCGNVIQGRAACHKTSNCLIQANTRLIACAGLENIVVIETPDALLIADRRNSDAMRSLVRTLKSAGCAEVTEKPGIKRAPRQPIRPAVAADFAIRPIPSVPESPAIYTPPPSNPQGPREVA